MNKINSPNIIPLSKDKYALIKPNKIYFTSKKGFEIEEISVNPLNKKEKNFITLTILPTYDCNLRCIYCYSKGGEKKNFMKKQLVKNVLDFYAKKVKKIHIRFAGGGEPFLNFDLMKYSINYAKTIFKEVSIHTITNGTFNNEQFNWLKENKSFVRISFDSLAQKLQRRFSNGQDSSDLVINNIKKVIKAKLPLAVQTIITSKSIDSMKDIIKFLYDLGVRDIKLEPVYISESSRGSENLMVSPKKFAENFIDTIKFIRQNNWQLLIDSSFISRPSVGFYCTMPEGNKVLTPEGNITSCIEISKKREPFSDLLLYGKWDNNKKKIILKQNLLKRLNKLHFSEFERCLTCNLKMICKGGCPIRHFWIMDNGISQHDYTCSIAKMLISQILKLISDDKEYSKILFHNFELKNEKKN